MAERFQRLYALEPNQYSKGCPIIIEAGALQKDTETGAVLAQIKMRNIGETTISSCRISIRAYATNGDEVEGVSDFSYLDLNASRGSEFGTKVPVILPDRTTRSFSVDIKEIVFSDGTVKKLRKNQWKPIQRQKTIDEVLENAELTKQYKVEAGGSADLYPEKKNGLFMCTCGAINLDSADNCYKCGKSYEELNKFLDRDYLNEKVEKRNRRLEIEKEYKKKKKKRLIMIAVAVVVVLLIAGIVNSVHKKNEARKVAEISNSLAGNSFTSESTIYGEGEHGHKYFTDNGKVKSSMYYYEKKEPEYDQIDVYAIKKIGKDKYALDIASSEKTLFYNGDYSYVITGLEGNQITEFTYINSYSSEGNEVYKIDSEKSSENDPFFDNLSGHVFESTSTKRHWRYEFFDDGICHEDYSEGEGSHSWDDYYEIRKKEDGEYVLDIGLYDDLFSQGADRFEITRIEDGQIIEIKERKSGAVFVLVK